MTSEALSPSFSPPPRSPPDLLYDVLTTTSAKNDAWTKISIGNIPYRIRNKVVAAAAGARNQVRSQNVAVENEPG
jgi:hypothetical protein